MKLTLQINGETEMVEVQPQELLIEVLRDRLHLTGTKEACEVGAIDLKIPWTPPG